jgi:hypothetical protein
LSHAIDCDCRGAKTDRRCAYLSVTDRPKREPREKPERLTPEPEKTLAPGIVVAPITYNPRRPWWE